MKFQQKLTRSRNGAASMSKSLTEQSMQSGSSDLGLAEKMRKGRRKNKMLSMVVARLDSNSKSVDVEPDKLAAELKEP